jgi:hypothetical protein
MPSMRTGPVRAPDYDVVAIDEPEQRPTGLSEPALPGLDSDRVSRAGVQENRHGAAQTGQSGRRSSLPCRQGCSPRKFTIT